MTTKKNHILPIGRFEFGFIVTKAVEIPELQCVLQELVHEASGAQIIHLANDDPENLFCLSFRTLPYNSNGVAHILEHTVLCGSEKFPVKDPFFAMSRRSLNTFMNALTGTDYTCYPAASQVAKDFYNLLEVYIDAVFHPNLNNISFKQEGHRLEFSNPMDSSTPLQYKGIVFNEMKGVLASPSARLSEAVSASLFPDLTYGYNSGGDPKVIPSLTYSELKEFHKKYYHPSQCLFFFYGNLPLKKHLEFIAEQALKNVKKAPPLPPIPRQPRFQHPIVKHSTYPISPDENPEGKTLVAVSWLTCHILDKQDLLGLEVLDIILMDTDASPLKMALLRSGLCKQANSYLEDEIHEVPFTITLKGCHSPDANQIESLIIGTLKRIITEGISLNAVENAIHQLEFERSEITGDQAPFGLSLFIRSALIKQHGGDPEDGLVIHSLFHQLHQRILENPHYLSGLIESYLINNPHRVTVIMSPDQQLAEKELNEEKAILEGIQIQLTPEKKQQIIREAVELMAFQKEQEDEGATDILPKVSLEDVPKKTRDYPLRHENIGALDVFHRNCFTNDILYSDLIFNLPDLSEDDLPYVRLFTVLFAQMGCGKRDYQSNLEYLQAHTGGFGASLAFNFQATDPSKFSPTLHIRGKALHRKANKLLPLIHEMVSLVDFSDTVRLKEVVVKHYTALQSSMNQQALRYAINQSSKGLNVSSKVANLWYGLDYFWKLKDISSHLNHQVDFLIEKLQEIKNKILHLGGAHLLLTCPTAIYEELKGHQFYGLPEMKTRPFTPWAGNYSLDRHGPQGYLIASPVAFTGKVFQTIPYMDPDAPALAVASFLFDNLVLHTEIREQGGAYGGGASCNTLSGSFYFYSYRDPHISSTLNAFEEAIKKVLSGDFDETDLEEAKLEMIQALDSPVAPGSQGDLAYGWQREGRTLAIRQGFRDKTLSLSCQDIIDAVERQIAPQFPKGATVVFAGRDLLDKENNQLKAMGREELKILSI